MNETNKILLEILNELRMLRLENTKPEFSCQLKLNDAKIIDIVEEKPKLSKIVKKEKFRLSKIVKKEKPKFGKRVKRKIDLYSIPKNVLVPLCKTGYPSPRWSGEILDCSMPMTFDTYSQCSYNCLFCFSYFQRSISSGSKTNNYLDRNIMSVNPKRIMKLFVDSLNGKSNSQFSTFIQQRVPMQWGGLSDQFDLYEKKYGVTLELLKFFKEINYPLCFSTKATWWAYDKRYTELFKGQKNWNVKVSIITLNNQKAKLMERGCPTSSERLNIIEEITNWDCGGATLRLRPFIIGLSDPDHKELIRHSAERGATAVSAEFFCLEARATKALKERYERMSDIVGYNMLEKYRKFSKGSGYLRLNRKLKRKYVDEMEETALNHGMRFYISDSHFKERCSNGSCCGLDESWNYSRGQFTNALVIAKKNGVVRWEDISQYLDYAKEFLWRKASGFNTKGAAQRAKYLDYSMYDYIRRIWNTPNSSSSPYKYFGGILIPKEIDKNGNVVYYYNKEVE